MYGGEDPHDCEWAATKAVTQAELDVTPLVHTSTHGSVASHYTKVRFPQNEAVNETEGETLKRIVLVK